MKREPIPLWRRSVAAFVLAQMALGPLATPAYAQLTLLADEPIAFRPSAPPNIVLTVDDSTSMLSDFLPDYVNGAFCRDSTGAITAACGFAGSPTSPQYIYSAGATLGTAMPYPKYGTGSPPNATAYTNSTIPDWMRAWPAPVHSNALNRLYYDPSITYSPPLKYDGTPYPDQVAPWTAVPADPWSVQLPLKTDNLTATVRVGMWCNSDHPNNTGWNPASGGGAECRINGADYSGVAPNAPADYLYPWRNTSGNDVRNFRFGASGTNTTWSKSIYCNTASPKFPKNLPCTVTGYTCPAPQTYIPPASQQQTCVYTGPLNGCIGPVTYNPAGCNTNPLYGSPGPCVGPECLICQQIACPTGQIGRQGACRLSSTLTGGSGAGCSCNTGAGCALPACPNYTPPGAGTCSGGAVPTPVTNCTNNTSNNCTLRLFNPVTGLNDGLTMFQDADGPGEVCRRNNKSYADGTVASPWNYPAAPYTSQKTGSCPTVPGYADVPRHYWKTSIEWCSSQITTANHRWRSFGQDGTCQDQRNSTYRYPRFYKYGVPKTDPSYLDNISFPAFERVDLTPTIPTYTHTFWRNGAAQTITRTYAQEMTNYANWFAFYRTRIQAAKTVVSQNFNYLDDAVRVGFHTLSNDPPTSYVDIDDFTLAQKNSWYTQLFGIQIRMGKQTPNMDAVVRIGELFKNGGNPALAGSRDPITLSCQKNYHMLFTDGITNQGALPAFTVGNVDSVVPALPEPLIVLPPIVAGSPWPDLYREDPANGLANTLADYTTHYWVTDFRPGMTNNVFARGRDPAPWQHLNFAALSLGTEGTLPSARVATENQIAAGALRWPKPIPTQFAPGPTGVDDLWHAAVNARGRFVNAKTSQELGMGIAQILKDFMEPAGGLTGTVLAGVSLSATNRHTYLAEFVQGWGGNVKKYEMDPTTGAPTTLIWNAADELTAQVTPTVPSPTPWITARRIVTRNEAGTPVPFLRANLGPTQLATLGPDAATQDRVIDFLRGDRSNEGEDFGQYRVRPSPLGDIVNAQPVFVGKSPWFYQEANDPGHPAFKTWTATRPARLYVGANDGMLHAIDEATGREAWAYIPRDFFRSAPPVSNDKAGLVGLTYQPGGLPLYAHRYYVDATPRVVDAYIGGSWKTLLVGGLGKGGKSYHALDVTDPGSVTDESSAAAKVLWEFRHADLGYTYGRPSIIKTRAFGGRWLAIVSAGYNNPSGEGKLFFLDAENGSLLKTMSTGEGNAANPSGLTHFNAYVRTHENQLAEQIYAGDLRGNLWRFNVEDVNDGNWTIERFARLTDSLGVPQPVTIEPWIEVDISNGVDRWVFVGTGRLLHEDDLADTQPQRMYAIRDGTYDTPRTTGLPVTPAVLDVVSGAAGLGTGVIAQHGWYDDLPAGQRIVRPIAAAVGIVAYIATGLPTDPCQVGQPAFFYARQFGNGETRLTNPGDEFISVPDGGAGVSFVSQFDPTCTENCIPKLAVIFTTTEPRNLVISVTLPPIFSQSRISWRQLGQ